MFRKVALLEILKHPLLTGVQAYSNAWRLTVTLGVQAYYNASKNKLLTKFLKVSIKITEKFPGSDL